MWNEFMCYAKGWDCKDKLISVAVSIGKSKRKIQIKPQLSWPRQYGKWEQ